MRRCGSLQDVYAYDKMQRPVVEDSSSPLAPLHAKLHPNKSMSFRLAPAHSFSSPSPKLPSKKSVSFRFLHRRSASSGSAERKDDGKLGSMVPSSSSAAAALPASAAPPPARQIGFPDLFVCCNSLFYPMPFCPSAAKRRQLYPTIGFSYKSEHRTQS